MAKKLAKKAAAKDKYEDTPRRRELLAIFAIQPTLAASNTLSVLHRETEFTFLSKELTEQTAQVLKGDMRNVEMMLFNQSVVLQSIFYDLAARAHRTEYVSHMEAYGRMAFRAQQQCQRTLKTLMEVRSPKQATFIKQQNNAVNQQINQGEQPKEISEKFDSANELLEHDHESRMDPGAPRDAIKGHQELEAVGEIKRAKD